MLEEGAISRLFGRVLRTVPDIYKPGTLTRVTLAANSEGGNTRTTATHDVMVQIAKCDEAMRDQPGYTAEDVKLIVLCEGVPVNEITTDDEVTTADGRRWSLYGVRLDSAGSHWTGRGVRRK